MAALPSYAEIARGGFKAQRTPDDPPAFDPLDTADLPLSLPAGTLSRTADLGTFETGAQICRVDAERREVWGVCATEEIGADGRVLDHDAVIRALEDWSGTQRNVGNLREAHDPHKAAGLSVYWEPLPEKREIYLGSRVSRGAEDTWLKIQDGVLRAYSIKGPILEQELRRMHRGGRTVMVPWVTKLAITEISYVDRPGDLGISRGGFDQIIRNADGCTDILDDQPMDLDPVVPVALSRADADPAPAALPEPADVTRAGGPGAGNPPHAPLTGEHTHPHAGYGAADTADDPHSHRHAHGEGGEPDANHGPDAGHTHAAVSREADPEPAPPAETERQMPVTSAEVLEFLRAYRTEHGRITRAATAPAMEQTDVAKGLELLQGLKDLYASEAAQYAAGDDNDLFDAHLIAEAIGTFEWWLCGERMESMRSEGGAMDPELAKMLAAQNDLLAQQTAILRGITDAQTANQSTQAALIERMDRLEAAQTDAVERSSTAAQERVSALEERLNTIGDTVVRVNRPVLHTEGAVVERLFPGDTIPTGHAEVSRAIGDVAADAKDRSVRDQARTMTVLESIRASRNAAHEQRHSELFGAGAGA